MLFKTFQFLLFALCFTSALAFPKGDGENKAANGTSTGGKGKGHKGNSTSVAAQCAEIQKLTAFMNLANNATKLASINATKADKIKSKAAEAQATLTKLESNTTLTEQCPAINAQRQLKSTCKLMKKLQKTVDRANNETALTAMAAKKNTTVDKLKEKATQADTKLKELQSNTTLMDSCAQLNQQKGSSGTTSAAASSSSSAAASAAVKSVSQSAFVTISAMVAFAAFMGIL